VYCGRVESEAGCAVAGAEVGTTVAVWVGMGVSVAVAVNVGRGVGLGRKVDVGDGVRLSIAGWKGVGVAVAFGSTVTRLRGGEEARGSPLGSVQDVKIKPQRTLSAQRFINLCVLRVLRGEEKVSINRSL
jgi:hypothetical protein